MIEAPAAATVTANAAILPAVAVPAQRAGTYITGDAKYIDTGCETVVGNQTCGYAGFQSVYWDTRKQIRWRNSTDPVGTFLKKVGGFIVDKAPAIAAATAVGVGCTATLVVCVVGSSFAFGATDRAIHGENPLDPAGTTMDVATGLAGWGVAKFLGAVDDAVRSIFAGSGDDAARAAATSTARPAIGFAPGEGASALTPGRLQHGTAHLTEKGVLPAWSGKNSPQLIRDTLSPILENPTATFNSTLGGRQVKGFIGTVNGQTVAVQVYAEGPSVGQLATSVVPTAKQLTKWGVAP
jgi:hypothetical protein